VAALAIVVHIHRGGKTTSAIPRYGKTDHAGIGLGQRPGVTDINGAIGQHPQLGAVLAVGVDVLDFPIDGDRRGKAAAAILRDADLDPASLHPGHPEAAPGIHIRTDRQAGLGRRRGGSHGAGSGFAMTLMGLGHR